MQNCLLDHHLLRLVGTAASNVDQSHNHGQLGAGESMLRIYGPQFQRATGHLVDKVKFLCKTRCRWRQQTGDNDVRNQGIKQLTWNCVSMTRVVFWRAGRFCSVQICVAFPGRPFVVMGEPEPCNSIQLKVRPRDHPKLLMRPAHAVACRKST